jgi:hypothetical protein
MPSIGLQLNWIPLVEKLVLKFEEQFFIAYGGHLHE